MPQIGTAIAVVGTAVKGAIAGISLGNLLATTALSMLGQVLKKTMMKPPKRPGIQTEYTTDGGTTPRKFVLGWYATAGQMVCPPMTHGRGNRMLTCVIALGSVPGMTIDTVLIDDKEVSFAPPPETEEEVEEVPEIGSIPTNRPAWWYEREEIEPPVPPPAPGGKWTFPGQPMQDDGRPATGDFKGKVWLHYHDGTQTEADPFLLAHFGPGTA